MSHEDGLDVSQYLNNSPLERSTEADMSPAGELINAEALQKRIQHLKEWLGDAKDVAKQTYPEIVKSMAFTGAEVGTSAVWLSQLNNSAAPIIFGLASGMRIGAVAGMSLEVIQNELQSPGGRYRREMRKINQRYPADDAGMTPERWKESDEAKARYRQERSAQLSPTDYLPANQPVDAVPDLFFYIEGEDEDER